MIYCWTNVPTARDKCKPDNARLSSLCNDSLAAISGSCWIPNRINTAHRFLWSPSAGHFVPNNTIHSESIDSTTPSISGTCRREQKVASCQHVRGRRIDRSERSGSVRSTRSAGTVAAVFSSSDGAAVSVRRQEWRGKGETCGKCGRAGVQEPECGLRLLSVMLVLVGSAPAADTGINIHWAECAD